MRKKPIVGLVVALATSILLALAAAPAGATHPPICDGEDLRHQECPEPPPRDGGCPDITAVLRIEESTGATGKVQTVTVFASNDNLDTNAGAHDAQLVVTYEANRFAAQEQTILAPSVADGGGFYGASFDVPRFRNVTGIVRASIEDVGCDGVNETVELH